MQSNIQKTTIVSLTLNEEEARWLKGMMQNQANPDSETQDDYEMRMKFWNALGGNPPNGGYENPT